MPDNGPGLSRAVVKPTVRTQIRYSHNYKLTRYTVEGIEGSILAGKANQIIVAEPGGPDPIFQALQTEDVGLERRMLRKTASSEPRALPQAVVQDAANDNDVTVFDHADNEEEVNGEVGTRMIAFGMNFGMPYKFIASGDSRSFEEAPAAVRMARSRIDWAQPMFTSPEGYQEFNEEIIFAYMEDQKMNYHDDGEEGLGPRIATLSLGGAATMSLRVKSKYHSQVSKTGIFTNEKPLSLPVLQSSGYIQGHEAKSKSAKDTYEGRVAAWEELEASKQTGTASKIKERSKELAAKLDLKVKPAEPLLSFRLTHSDIVIMEGEKIQKFLEHAIEPHGNLRFALTCRTILPHHLTAEQAPKYEVLPDSEGYDGSQIREEGDLHAVVW
jgi:hypothetical protein